MHNQAPSRQPVTAASAPSLRCGLVVPSLSGGGLEETVALLAVALPAYGVSVSVLCTHEGGVIAERLDAAGIPVVVGRGSPRRWRSWVKDAAPDVISTHFASLKAVELLSMSAPVVETVQNTYVWFSSADWAEERAKCAMASSIVAVSETVAAYHQRSCGHLPNLTVIPNGVLPARMVATPRLEARARLGLGADDIVLVSIARFCEQKNQVGLVDAIAGILREDNRLRLVLVGGQDDTAYVDRVVSQAGELVARGAVRLLPYTPDPRLALSAADAFVANSFFEGWSLAATEALWLGRPVILSDCGGSRELVGDDGRRGILVPNPGGDPTSLDLDQVRHPAADVVTRNREALQNAVRSMAANRQQWADRADAIAREAQARWSAERVAEHYAAVLRTASQPSKPADRLL